MDDLEMDLGDLGLDPESGEDPSQEDPGQAGDQPEGGESFYDPSKVPEELQPTFRDMKKAFTQKTQALAEVRRKAEEALRTSSLHQQKAVAFDQLLQDTRVRDFLQRLDNPDSGSEDPTESDPVMMQAIERATAPLRQRLEQMQGQLGQRDAFAEFQQSHPDWNKYKGDMQKAWEQDRLAGRGFRSYEDAYNWAVVQKVKAVRAQRQTQQPQAGVESRGVGRPVIPAGPDLKGSSSEAFKSSLAWALDQLGIDKKAFNSAKANQLPMK